MAPGHEIEQGQYPWRDPYSFRPIAEPELNPAAWPFGLPFWPLWRGLGVVVGWNVFVLLGLVAAGLLAYAWLRELGLGVGAALVGGLAFEVAPYRLEQTAAGHLLAPISALLPLSLWTFERARRGSRWWLLPSALAIASIPASGQVHLSLGAVPFYLAYVLVRTRAPWPVVGAVVGVALAAAAGVLVWLFTIEDSIGEGGRSLRQVGRFSADWLDFVVRHDRHGSESFVFLGWLTPLVALAGLVILVRRRTYGLAGLFGAATLVPVVLALGTTTPIYEAVRFLVWPLRYPRVPERLMPIACLAIAALVAYAVDELATRELPWRVPRRAIVVACLAVVLLLADLRVTTFEATAADQGNDAYAALRNGPPGRVLEVPVFRPGIHYGGVYLYYATQVTAAAAAGLLDARARGGRRAREGAGGGQLRRLDRPAGRAARSPRRHERRLPRGAVPRQPGSAGHGRLRMGGARAPRLPATGGRRAGHAAGTARRRAAASVPVDYPPRDVAQFCDGWRPNDGEGRVTSARHASLWAYNAGGADLRLFLRRDAGPADLRHRRRSAGARRSGVEPQRNTLPLGDEGWHLVTLDGPPGVRVRTR